MVSLFSIMETSYVAEERMTFYLSLGLILANSCACLSLNSLIRSWRLCLKSYAFWRIYEVVVLPAPIWWFVLKKIHYFRE